MRIGIFADKPFASTGFAVVCRNLAKQLGYHKDLEVYYFGRFGCEKEYEEPVTLDNYLYVKCEGGVWNRELCVRLIDNFKLDLVFTEDDWFSIEGIQEATSFWEKPFFWLTPIDSLPVRMEGLHHMRKATRLFVPSRGAQTYLKGKEINAYYLPHGVNTSDFRPFEVDNKPDQFTFVWVGRDSSRKCLGRVILAFEKLIRSGYKSYLLVRADWNVTQAKRTYNYIARRNLPVITEQTEDIPHRELAKTYNRGDCYICSTKAGGFELGVIEAQACSLPVLVIDHTFMNEQVVNGRNGFLVNLDGNKPFMVGKHGGIWGNISVKDLANKMMFYVDHPEIARTHGVYGMGWVNKTYKWSRCGRIIYEQIKKIQE